MNEHPSNPVDPMFEAFLDGTLSAADEATMRKRISSDPRLRAQVREQNQIDASLRRLFVPPVPLPPAEPATASADRVSDAKPRSPLRRLNPRNVRRRMGARLLAQVAIIAIGLGYAGWTLMDYMLSGNGFGGRQTAMPYRSGPNPYATGAASTPTTFMAAYKGIVEGGFKPDWVCENDAQFADSFRNQLGQPMRFRDDPPRVTMAGLSYRWVLSPDTVVFLGTVGDERALVFVDRLARDEACTVPTDQGLQLFRRVVGDLVLYELTPLDAPALLGRFEAVAAP